MLGIGLGVFVGVVGLIGVANTLAMTVAYRIRELGLRSALGWSRRRLAGLILVESLLAGALASVIGAAVGLLGLSLWCAGQGLELIVDPRWVLAAITGGVGAAGLGGILPAIQAGSISPMEPCAADECRRVDARPPLGKILVLEKIHRSVAESAVTLQPPLVVHVTARRNP